MVQSKLRDRLLRWVRPLRKTPLHPQWLIFRSQGLFHTKTARKARGLVLDIGAGEGNIRRVLPEDCTYLALDYYQTAVEWYGTRPHVFGDAQDLPIADAQVDTILLLDVLEHLPSPERALAECFRVLKPGGRLLLQVPFLYPVHDAPRDFTRWTAFGIEHIAEREGFRVEEVEATSTAAASWGALAAMGAAHSVMDWLERRHVAGLSVLLLPALVLLLNLTAALADALSKADTHFCQGYLAALVKP